jgi:hypothetical protein
MPRSLLPVVASVLVCLAVAGCSSSSSSGHGSTASAASGGAATSSAAPAGGASTSAAAGTPSSSAGSASPPATAAASGGSGSCPSAAAVSAAVGSTYPAPKILKSTGTLVCTYESSSVNLVIDFATLTVSASELKAVAASQAQAQHVGITSVSGLGDAAYAFTLKDGATNSDGVATSTLLVLKGSQDTTLVGELTVPKLEAVARLVVG